MVNPNNWNYIVVMHNHSSRLVLGVRATSDRAVIHFLVCLLIGCGGHVDDAQSSPQLFDAGTPETDMRDAAVDTGPSIDAAHPPWESSRIEELLEPCKNTENTLVINGSKSAFVVGGKGWGAASDTYAWFSPGNASLTFSTEGLRLPLETRLYSNAISANLGMTLGYPAIAATVDSDGSTGGGWFQVLSIETYAHGITRFIAVFELTWEATNPHDTRAYGCIRYQKSPG